MQNLLHNLKQTNRGSKYLYSKDDNCGWRLSSTSRQLCRGVPPSLRYGSGSAELRLLGVSQLRGDKLASWPAEGQAEPDMPDTGYSNIHEVLTVLTEFEAFFINLDRSNPSVPECPKVS